MIKNQKVAILVILAAMFLIFQWFLVTQKPFLLGFAIILLSIFAFKKLTEEWIFTILPSVWLFLALSILYFFPSQIIVSTAVLGYFAILTIALRQEYSWWQATGILNVWLLSSLSWFLVLAQALDFLLSVVIISFGSFLIFLQSFFILRRSGELIKIKRKNQIFVLSLGVFIGMAQTAWAVSFLPFGYFILGALFTTIFSGVLNIISAYYKTVSDNETAFKKFLLKNIAGVFIFILIFIIISPWLPQK